MNGPTAWERWELASLDSTPPPEAAPVALPGLDRAEIERICAEAREEGYQAGYQSGYQIGKSNGYEEGQTLVRTEAARIGAAANELDLALREFDQQVADELLALAMEIARQIVRGEIVARPGHILGIVNEALTHLPHQHAAIRLHPADASLVRSYLGDVLTHAGHRIFEEPTLKRGDCLLEAGGSQIDATTATRWRRVIENLGGLSAWDSGE